MKVAGYAAQRLLLALMTAFFVAVLVFVLIRSVPGDPAQILTEQFGATPGQIAAINAQLGLDQSVITQFFVWCQGMLVGDFGTSYVQGRPNADVIAPALFNTLRLGGLAVLFAIAIGLVLGNLANAGSRVVRRIADGIEVVLLSAPQYTVALVLLVVFAVLLPWFPSGGLGGADANAGEVLRHLLLPATALALPFGAQLGRTLKTSIAGLSDTELLPALSARGLSPWRLSMHLHQNALPPMVTVLGFQVGTMLGGALFVETIFSISGLGNGLIMAVGLRDYSLVQAYTMVIALIFILAILAADLLNLLLDPRMRRATR